MNHIVLITLSVVTIILSSCDSSTSSIDTSKNSGSSNPSGKTNNSIDSVSSKVSAIVGKWKFSNNDDTVIYEFSSDFKSTYWRHYRFINPVESGKNHYKHWRGCGTWDIVGDSIYVTLTDTFYDTSLLFHPNNPTIQTSNFKDYRVLYFAQGAKQNYLFETGNQYIKQ